MVILDSGMCKPQLLSFLIIVQQLRIVGSILIVPNDANQHLALVTWLYLSCIIGICSLNPHF